MLAAPDVVVLTVPADRRDEGADRTAQLRRMKPDAVLVNVARGKLVREEELAAAAGDGHASPARRSTCSSTSR